MSADHIVTSFGEEMDQIESLVLEMGGLVEQQLVNVTTALRKEDRALAKQVRKTDADINALQADLNDAAIRILALRQPVAMDLRIVVMSLKIGTHLERIGDYIKNTARRINTIAKADAFAGSVGTLVRMSELVQDMTKAALDAYAQRDAQAAENVRAEDENVDLMNNTLFRELLTYMMEDVKNVSGAMHLLFIAKNIERMGDHVADIAQETIYMASGQWPKVKRNKEDNTSKMIIDPSEIEEDAS